MIDADNLEILAVFESQYSGTCILNWDHKIKRGARVARVGRTDNPFIPVSGLVCWSCAKMLPRA